MELLEYQAKTLFQEVGLPVLPSQQIYAPRDLKQLQIPYPIVLKSQVRAGGRGRAGGVRFAENTIDAITAAQTILNLSIGGEYPELLLAEARYQPEQELYLAVVLDYHQQLPLLLGSAHGGVDVDTALDQVQIVAVDGDFSPFYARRLAIQMGLTGDRITTVSRIVEKMYGLFALKDLDSVEINPLGLKADGQVMALDGKITLSAAAVDRHPELKLILDIAPPQRRATTIWQKPQGNIGLLCTDTGLAMMLWDTLTAARCAVRSCVVLAADEQFATQCAKSIEQWHNDDDYAHIVLALPSRTLLNPVVQAAISDELAAKLTFYSPGLTAVDFTLEYPMVESLTALIHRVKSNPAC